MNATRSGRGGTLLRRGAPLLLGVALSGLAMLKDVGGPNAGDFGLQQSLVLLAGLIALLEALASWREERFPALVAAIERGDRFGVLLVRLLAVVLASTWLFDFRDYLVDDSYISFRFARNLADGHGLVWNPGEPAVEGFSNLAWTLMAALALRAGLDPLVVSRVVGAACVLLSLFVVHRTALRLTRRPGSAAVAPLTLACIPAFGFWAMSGLETASVVLLVAILMDALVHEESREAWPWRTALAAVLLAASRPETPVAVALLVVPVVVGRGRAAIGWLARFAVLVVPPVLALMAWRWIWFGSVIPNTLVAKAHFLAGAPLSAGFVVYALPLWGALAIRFATGRADAFDRGAASLTAGWLLAALSIAPQVAHDLRFFLPVLPPLLLSAACTWDDLATARAGVSRAGRLALAGALAVTLAMPAFEMKRYATLESDGLRRAHMRIGDELRRCLPPDALIAASDVGLIAYRSGRNVLDLWGLADRHIARRGFDPADVLSREPRIVILHSLDGRIFRGREPYDRALHQRLESRTEWTVLERVPFFGYSLWVFGRQVDVAPSFGTARR